MIRNSYDEGVEEKDYCADCELMILLENATEHLLPSQSCQELDMTKG
jgi:hypothetical protein